MQYEPVTRTFCCEDHKIKVTELEKDIISQEQKMTEADCQTWGRL